MLDPRGTQVTTEELAAAVSDATRIGTGRLVFAIGGPFGHAPATRTRAWKELALSRLVLNHELARVVLYEQLYRVTDILWGGASTTTEGSSPSSEGAGVTKRPRGRAFA